MTEKKKPIPTPTPTPTPKPTIRNTAAVKPPVTFADSEEAKAPEVKEEEALSSEPASIVNGVETDLVKRFLAAFIDCLVAGVLASIVGVITGVDLLQYLVWGLVMLIKDSLPILEGQSIGKKVMKIRAVKEDGSSLSGDWVTGATRNVLLAIPVAGIIECFIILTRSGNPEAGLRLGDDWAKTKVIAVD